MKKILLLSLVLTLLCWSFASAADVAASAKGSVQTKVVKALPNKEKVPVSLREEAPKIEAISPNSTTNVGGEAITPVQPMTTGNDSKGPSAYAPFNGVVKSGQSGYLTTPNGQVHLGAPITPPVSADVIFSEGFENGGTIPAGWTDVPGTTPWLYNGGTSGSPYPGAPHGGSYAACYNIYSYPTGSTDALISPSIDLSTHSGSYVLSFYYWDNTDPFGYLDYAELFLIQDGIETSLGVLPTNTTGWTELMFSFASTSSDVKIKFFGYSDYGYTDPYVDDVLIYDQGTVFTGRRCYGDPLVPQCADTTPEDCATLSGTWTLGITCASDPCPVAVLGDACAAPFVIGSLPYTDTQDLTPFLNEYNGHGNDVVYTFTLAERAMLDLTLCNTVTGFDTWMGIWADGSCGTTTFVTSDDDGCGYPPGLSHIAGAILEPGTYYLLVEAYSASGTYTLDITSEPAPEPPANDECTNAEPIVGPYPVTVTGTTIGAGIDCAGLLDWNGVWYTIDLPYASNDLTVDFCPTPDLEVYNVGIVVMPDCGCTSYTLMSYVFATCGSGLTQPTLTLSHIAGPGTIYFPAYASLTAPNHTGMDFSFTVNVAEYNPCVLEIPVEATPEGETDCGAEYVDTYNGGCNSSPTIFQDITAPAIIAGKSGNYMFGTSQYRDTDWFQYVPTEMEIAHWKVIAEFPLLLFVIDGTAGCYGTTIGTATAAECETTEVVTPMLCPGNTYWFWVGPSVFTGYDCPKNYVAWLTTEPVTFEPAPNDVCTDVPAVPLYAGTPLQFTGDNTNSSTCGDYAPFTSYPTVWHGFTTTECLDIVVDYCGTTPAFGNAWLILQVDCPGTATVGALSYDQTTCPDGNVTIVFHHVPAGTYYYGVMKDELTGAVGPYVINVNGTVCPPPPANDNCADAEIVGEVVAQPWSTLDATADGAAACMTSANIWYLYTASANANVTVSLCGTGFDTKLAVYEGNICPEPPPPPPTPIDFQGGEDIASAAVITDALPVAYAGTTVGLVNDYDEACTFTGSLSPDAVYSYTPAANITMDITMCGSGYDTKLYVYENSYTPGLPFACNDDAGYCTDDPYKSALFGLNFVAGNTYYIVVDGYGSGSGAYQINLLPPSTTSYVMIECNDDFCGLQSEITFAATSGTQYLIEVGGFSANVGEGVLTISVPPAHDAGVATIDVPRIGELMDGSAPIEVIATIGNFGLNTETFNIVAVDDHGYSSTYANLTLDAGTTQQIAFPDLFNPTTTCLDYNFSVTTQLAGDLNPANDAMAANYRVARTATETFQNDDDVVANGWYFYAETNLIAVQYTADIEYDIAYVAARTYAGELGGSWPDALVDPFKLYLFLDADLDGYPDADPVGESTVWPTGVSPSVSYGVLDCGIHVLPGDNFWVAFSQIEDAPAHGSEGIAQDAVTDFPAAKWYRLDGVWTQAEQYAGDEMLRAYAAGALGTISGIAYNVAPPTVLPNVHVVTYDAGNVVVDDRISDALGVWTVTLPPGTYRQHLDKIGFQDADINGIVVTAGGTANVSYNMLLAGGCHYTIGDANGSGTYTGLDVTYSVRYFKGGPPPPYSCPCPVTAWYVGGDVNGSCSFTGLDVTYSVRYFKGGAGPIACPTCPPTADILILTPKSNTGSVIGTGSGQ